MMRVSNLFDGAHLQTAACELTLGMLLVRYDEVNGSLKNKKQLLYGKENYNRYATRNSGTGKPAGMAATFSTRRSTPAR
jgi:hypothetical protein